MYRAREVEVYSSAPERSDVLIRCLRPNTRDPDPDGPEGQEGTSSYQWYKHIETSDLRPRDEKGIELHLRWNGQE